MTRQVEIVLHFKIEPVFAYIVYEVVPDVFLRLGFGYEGELVEVFSEVCDIGCFLNAGEFYYGGQFLIAYSLRFL